MYFCPFMSTKDEKVPCTEDCSLAVIRGNKQKQEIRCSILQLALLKETELEKD